METDETREYEFLWTTKKGEWALQVIRHEAGKPFTYLIVNTVTNAALLMDDAELSLRLKQKMLEEGNRVIDGE